MMAAGVRNQYRIHLGFDAAAGRAWDVGMQLGLTEIAGTNFGRTKV